MYPMRLCASGLSALISRLFWAETRAPARSPRLTKSHPRSRCAVNWSIGPRLPMIARKVRAPAARSSRRTAAPWPWLGWMAVLVAVAGCGLAPLPQAATSLGYATDGVLLASAALPQSGPGFTRARPGDDTQFGVPLLVAALTRAARGVASEFPGGSPLR